MADTDPATVLADPLALELLGSSTPARIAYAATDGTPRAIPVGFHWDGRRIVLGTHPSGYKVEALRRRPQIALTIDTNVAPHDVLLVRGTAEIEIVDGVFPEFLEGARKLVPRKGWDDFVQYVEAAYEQMARISITPTWAKLFDFQTRVPEVLERLAAEHGDDRARERPA